MNDIISLGAAVFGSLVAGALIGLIPLILGQKRGMRGVGIGGFIGCIVGSFILGLFLSIPVCLIFTLIILLSKKKETSVPVTINQPMPTPVPTTPEPPVPPMSKCSHCGGSIAQGQPFCPYCGARQAADPAVKCPSCGADVPEGMFFCSKCGTRVR